MFKQKKKTVALRIGEGIPYENYANDNLPTKTKVKLFHKHLYRIAHNKTGIFKTQSAIAFPEQRQTLKKALKQCQHLGSTNDGKDIYLYNYDESSPILREIGRLREVAFRAVGEGTGKKRDIDKRIEEIAHSESMKKPIIVLGKGILFINWSINPIIRKFIQRIVFIFAS